MIIYDIILYIVIYKCIRCRVRGKGYTSILLGHVILTIVYNMPSNLGRIGGGGGVNLILFYI